MSEERAHVEFSLDCWCHPDVIFEAPNGSKVIVHKGPGDELPPAKIIAEAIADAFAADDEDEAELRFRIIGTPPDDQVNEGRMLTLEEVGQLLGLDQTARELMNERSQMAALCSFMGYTFEVVRGDRHE